MISEIKADTEKRMQKTVDSLEHELGKIRTGRANAGLLDHIQIDYYGSQMPLQQVASVTTPDARTLLVTPWEKQMLPVIEKAILTADLGLNPATAGTAIRVPMPPLTEERRKELIKVVRGECEQAKVSIRNVRRDVNQRLKESVKEKSLTEDQEKQGMDMTQKTTDKFTALVDHILQAKEKELMEI